MEFFGTIDKPKVGTRKVYVVVGKSHAISW